MQSHSENSEEKLGAGPPAKLNKGPLVPTVRKVGGPGKYNKVTHGRSKTPLYKAWFAMKRRCQNPKVECYKDYGARGISVCAEWDEFSGFLKSMGERPPNSTLERKDNDKGYSPDNCIWATMKQQGRNRRNNRKVDGVCLSEWGERNGLSCPIIAGRLNIGWPPHLAVSVPVGVRLAKAIKLYSK